MKFSFPCTFNVINCSFKTATVYTGQLSLLSLMVWEISSRPTGAVVCRDGVLEAVASRPANGVLGLGLEAPVLGLGAVVLGLRLGCQVLGLGLAK